jgi:hypothetical protein
MRFSSDEVQRTEHQAGFHFIGCKSRDLPNQGVVPVEEETRTAIICTTPTVVFRDEPAAENNGSAWNYWIVIVPS